jgi:hypothetical protein
MSIMMPVLRQRGMQRPHSDIDTMIDYLHKPALAMMTLCGVDHLLHNIDLVPGLWSATSVPKRGVADTFDPHLPLIMAV